MKRNFWRRQLPLTLLAGGLIVTVAAWQTHPGQSSHTPTDTTPNREIKARDIDQALEDLKKGQVEMEQSLKNMDLKEMQKNVEEGIRQIDAAKIKSELDQAMKELDADKIKLQVQKEMAQIDLQKMKAEAQKQLAEIDQEKINAEVQRALKSIDEEKIRASVDAAMQNFDAEKIKQQIKQIDMEKLKEQMKNLRPDIEKAMTGAREDMNRAEKELRGYKALIDEMDRDGLINKKDHYTIEYRDQNLIINGKTQSPETTEKYRHYFEKGSTKITD